MRETRLEREMPYQVAVPQAAERVFGLRADSYRTASGNDFARVNSTRWFATWYFKTEDDAAEFYKAAGSPVVPTRKL